MNNIIIVDYDLIPEEKRCAGLCKEYLPATSDYFYSNQARGDGFETNCKVCAKEIKREKYHRKILVKENIIDKIK